jgi:serine/threonine protein kinase
MYTISTFNHRAGELFDRISHQVRFTEAEASQIMRPVISAVAYLHSLSIAHRDIKPENLIFVHKGPDSDVKLCDFGLSKRSTEGDVLQTCVPPF